VWPPSQFRLAGPHLETPRVYHYARPAFAVLKTWHNAAIRSGFLDAVAYMHQSLTKHERDAGMPVGLLLSGLANNDDRLLGAALAVEDAISEFSE